MVPAVTAAARLAAAAAERWPMTPRPTPTPSMTAPMGSTAGISPSGTSVENQPQDRQRQWLVLSDDDAPRLIPGRGDPHLQRLRPQAPARGRKYVCTQGVAQLRLL